MSSFNAKAGRPTTDSITAAQKYARLSKSQNRVIAKMAGVCPKSLYPRVAYSALPTLTTTDNQRFTFGTDGQGYAVFPIGHARIYDSLSDVPDYPWSEGVDYISEGTQIRIPNNGTYSGTLYWYGITNPADINATDQPSLFPEASRELIVIDAVRQFAQEGVRNLPLADEMKAEWDEAWPTWCTTWKTAFRSGGALLHTGRDLALAAQY